MRNRLIYGFLIGVIVTGVLFLSMYVVDVVYDAFVLFLMFVGAHEMSKAIGNKFAKPIYPIVAIFIALGYVSFKVIHAINGYGGITAFFVIMIIMVVVCFIVNMASPKLSFENVVSTFICMLYPVGIMVCLLGLNYLPGSGVSVNWFERFGADQGVLKLGLAFEKETPWMYNVMQTVTDPTNPGATVQVYSPNFRSVAILATVLCASGADIFALFTGMLLKGPKLAPTISPKKTISGAIGGLFGGMIMAAMLFGLSFTGVMGLTGLHPNVAISLVLYLALGLLVAAATELGDLMASYIKRFCDVKDYGTLIPGHGGVLDRIDGWILGAMVAFLFVTLMMAIPGV